MVKIYYSNGIDTGAQRSVQAIVQRNEEGVWNVESHGDYYLFRNERWYAADYSGLHTELLKREIFNPSATGNHLALVGDKWVTIKTQAAFEAWLDTLDWVLCGETLDNQSFHAIFQAALADADYARRHGELP